MKLTIYSYALEDRRLGISIYTHPSIEAREKAIEEHLKQIASDEGVDLDPDGEPCDWAEQLGIGLTYDSCVMDLLVLDELALALAGMIGDWERCHSKLPADHEARAALTRYYKLKS